MKSYRLPALPAVLLLPLALTLNAAPAQRRTKTVAYNFGAFYGDKSLRPGEIFAFPERTIRLPERDKVLRSAWFEYEGQLASALPHKGLNLYLSTDAEFGAPVASAPAARGRNASGRVSFRGDVTALLERSLEELEAGQKFIGAVSVAGPPPTTHTLRLLITYDYDPDSPRQAQTVRYPMRPLPSAMEDRALFAYFAEAGEDADIQQQWFELRGRAPQRPNRDSKPPTISCALPGQAAEPAMELRSIPGVDLKFLYLSSSSVSGGFAMNTSQTLEVSAPPETLAGLEAAVVVTFESGRGETSPASLPPPPENLFQRAGSRGARLARRGWTNSREIHLGAYIKSPPDGEDVALVVEAKPASIPFDGTSLSTGAWISPRGTAAAASVAASGIFVGELPYLWRARTLSAAGTAGPWTDFGPRSAGRFDLAVDITPPRPPALRDIVPADYVSLSTGTGLLDWEDAEDLTGSGLRWYEVELSRFPDFIIVSTRIATSVSETKFDGLSEGSYFWRVRSRDNAGNLGPYSPIRRFRVEPPLASERTPVEMVLIGISLLVFLSHLCSALFEKTRIPDVLPLLALGLMIGPILGLVTPAAFGKVGAVFAIATLVVILFESGLGLNLAAVRASLGEGMRLTMASFLSVVVVVALTCWATDFLPLLQGAMLGAILGGTSAAVVIPIVARIPLQEKSRTTLILESTLSDVLCIVVTLALLQSVGEKSLNPGALLGRIIASFLLAALIGSAGAVFWARILEQVRELENSLFTTPVFVILVYGISELLGFSGAIAALAFGMALGNIELLHSQAPLLRRLLPTQNLRLNQVERALFSELGFLFKTFFFVYMGLSIQFRSTGPILFAALLCLLLYLARIMIVRQTLDLSNTQSDAAVAAAMIPKGLAAAVLASLPAQAGIPGGEVLQDAAYAVVLISIVASSILVFTLASGKGKSFVAGLFGPFRREP